MRVYNLITIGGDTFSASPLIVTGGANSAASLSLEHKQTLFKFSVSIVTMKSFASFPHFYLIKVGSVKLESLYNFSSIHGSVLHSSHSGRLLSRVKVVYRLESYLFCTYTAAGGKVVPRVVGASIPSFPIRTIFERTAISLNLV